MATAAPLTAERALDVLEDLGLNIRDVDNDTASKVAELCMQVPPAARRAFARYLPSDFTGADPIDASMVDAFSAHYVGTYHESDFVRDYVQCAHGDETARALTPYINTTALFEALTALNGPYRAVPAGDGSYDVYVAPGRPQGGPAHLRPAREVQ